MHLLCYGDVAVVFCRPCFSLLAALVLVSLCCVVFFSALVCRYSLPDMSRSAVSAIECALCGQQSWWPRGGRCHLLRLCLHLLSVVRSFVCCLFVVLRSPGTSVALIGSPTSLFSWPVLCPAFVSCAPYRCVIVAAYVINTVESARGFAIIITPTILVVLAFPFAGGSRPFILAFCMCLCALFWLASVSFWAPLGIVRRMFIRSLLARRMEPPVLHQYGCVSLRLLLQFSVVLPTVVVLPSISLSCGVATAAAHLLSPTSCSFPVHFLSPICAHIRWLSAGCRDAAATVTVLCFVVSPLSP